MLAHMYCRVSTVPGFWGRLHIRQNSWACVRAQGWLADDVLIPTHLSDTLSTHCLSLPRVHNVECSGGGRVSSLPRGQLVPVSGQFER